MRFARVTWSAGSSPLTTLITNDSATTNAIVRSVGSNVIQNGTSVIMPTRNLSDTWASASPITDAIAQRIATSANNWPTTRERPAPIAVRTASSDDRDHVRANTSEAMFEATTSSASTRTATSPDITVLISVVVAREWQRANRDRRAWPARPLGTRVRTQLRCRASNRESLAEDAKHRERGRPSGECRFIQRHPDFTAGGKLERIGKHADNGACPARELN